MMGADMCVASLSALVETIAPDAAQMLEINRVPITYFLCFCGWRTQYNLRPEPEPEQPPGEAAAMAVDLERTARAARFFPLMGSP